MNRTLRFKIGYIVALVLLGAAAVGTLAYFKWSPAALVIAVGLLLVPGRVQGHYWREFFSGRRFLSVDRPRDAIEHFNRFLADLEQRPWLRKLMWLSWAIYTPSIEVMTRNNIGVALLKLGEVEGAEREFRTAIQLDPKAPLPWHNLAIILEMGGRAGEAAEAVRRARDLGFRGSATDEVVRRGGELFAKVEGHGK